MGRVLTNNTSYSYTIETALGVAGTTWFLLEPNSIGTFGANITTVARNPISRNRQRRKGTITDLDSSVDFEEDMTISSFRDFIEGFVFVNGINTDVTDITSTAAETTTDSYAVAALTLAQANKMEIDTLLWVTGFTTPANNGLKAVDADIGSGAVAITVAENLTDEPSPPANARLSFTGHRIATGDTPTWTWSSGNKQATLNETGIGTALQALGLTAGQMIHVGSIAASGDTTIVNAFENAAANDMFGYARVVEFTDADNIIFDKVDTALQFTDAVAPATAVDIMFGEFIRNVPTTHADFLERSFQFEAEYPNLDTGGADMFQYALGNYCNTASFALPLTNKATIGFGFIGTDTEPPVSVGSRKSGASTATDPVDTTAFNTTNDIARLRITDVDEDGITTDFKSLTMTLNNNVSPEKVLGQLGAKYMNTGNFDVDIESQLVFSNAAVIQKIRDNETVTMDFILKNDEGVIGVDFPTLTLGGGGLELPVNESVLINTTGMAFQDEVLETSIGVSLFPIPLP